MSEKKRIELTRLQGGIAIASFTAGVLIAAVCLCWIEPKGEIANSGPVRCHPRSEGLLRRQVPEV